MIKFILSLFFLVYISVDAQHFVAIPSLPISDSLGQNYYNVVWQEVDGQKPGVAVKNRKVEIGIQMSTFVNQAISRFVQEKRGFRINPFNPQDIEVEAQFFVLNEGQSAFSSLPMKEWLGPLKVYGYYHLDYSRNTKHPDPNKWNWKKENLVDEVNSKYNFRIRFTPVYTGTWWVKLVVKIKGEVLEFSPEFTFKTIDENEQGFVEVGSNGHYLQRDGKTLFPVGKNIPTQWCWHPDGDDPHGCEKVHCKTPWCGRKYESPSPYLAYLDELKTYLKGIKYFRMLFYPESYEIEFEDLNNYYPRLNNAWEFDQLVGLAEENDALIHFNLQVHHALEEVGSFYTFGWDFSKFEDYADKAKTGYCANPADSGYAYARHYKLKDPIAFLTHEGCIQNYKNRLRYIVSRWGYSNAIAVFELFSEVNNLGARHQYRESTYTDNNGQVQRRCDGDPNVPPYFPYSDTARNVPVLIYKWQNEMCKFLKEDQYFPHLTGVSYTGFDATNVLRGDSTYYSPFVDVASSNHYAFGGLANWAVHQMTDWLHYNNEVKVQGKKYRFEPIKKPFINSEIGSDSYSFCGNYIELYKDLWITAMSGVAMPAMSWIHWHDYNVLPIYKNLESYMNNIDFNGQTSSWKSFSGYRYGDHKAALYGLQSSDSLKRAIGCIVNNTANYYTLGDSSCKQIPIKDRFKTPVVVYPGRKFSQSKNKLKLEKLDKRKKYIIEWHNVTANKPIRTAEIKTGRSGKLRLEFPEIAADYTGNGPILAFKLRDAELPDFIIQEKKQPVLMSIQNQINVAKQQPAAITKW